MRQLTSRVLSVLVLVTGLQAGAGAKGALPDFTELVEANGPAVVNISTTRKVAARPALPPGIEIPDVPEDSMLDEFLRRFFGEEGPGESEAFETSSLGSGFILSDDGFVVTNYHVVKGAEEVVVRLSDRRELDAEVVGADRRTDLALLKVDANGLPTLEIGTSDSLRVGEWVLAIGSPFGFEHSVTAGIVSAKGRSLPDENYVPFIQTDVAINPGNSGGPLLDLDGKVVGINSQIYSRTGGFMGLSFSIPVDIAMQVIEQLKEQGHVSRGWLGVYIQEVTQDLAQSFGLDKPSGALVTRVVPGSPAAQAGIRVGDVILEYRGEGVPGSSTLPPMVGMTPVGESVEVTVLRSGRRLDLDVTVGELPSQAELTQREARSGAAGWVLGMRVAPVPKDVREQRDLASGGVLVREVKDPARRSGVRAGDVITMINNRPVGSVAAFMEVVKGLPKGQPVPVLVQREEGPIFLALQVRR